MSAAPVPPSPPTNILRPYCFCTLKKNKARVVFYTSVSWVFKTPTCASSKHASVNFGGQARGRSEVNPHDLESATISVIVPEGHVPAQFDAVRMENIDFNRSKYDGSKADGLLSCEETNNETEEGEEEKEEEGRLKSISRAEQSRAEASLIVTAERKLHDTTQQKVS
ncbi:hypothetical protein INR49_002703 [Caranx melampygus]|nr:hypothetical protein INR49_002703 [Caranx melampygus]